MKILIVRNSPTTINLNNYNVQEIGLARELSTKKCEVGIVFYSDKYEEKIIDNIKIYFLPGKKQLNHVIYDDIIYEIAKRYDIIQTSEYNQIMSYRLCEKFPMKTIIYHGPYFRKNILTIVNNFLFDILYLKKYRKINPTIMAKSELAKKFLLQKKFKNVITVGVGLDESKFNAKNIEAKEFRKYYNKKDKNILYIGTIDKRKNTLFLLKVLKKLIKCDENFKLYLIGKENEKYKNKCIRYINKNQMNSKVVFIKNINQNEIKDVYEHCDIFLLPSTYEIFGMVLLEAMYFNIPIVSSLNGGSSYLLSENNIEKSFEVKKWVKKIIQINNEECIYDKKILWKDVADRFIEIYKIKLKRREMENDN